MNREEQYLFLENLSGILLRCFFLTIALLGIWFVLFLLAGDIGFYLHSHWFEIDERDFDLLSYYGMAFLKIYAFVFFLFPYIAIRQVLRKIKAS